MFVCIDVGVAAAYVVFAMVGIMLVCMDLGVAAAYVVFALVGLMLVCMDVGVAAGAHLSLFQCEGVLSKRIKYTKYVLPPLGEG